MAVQRVTVAISGAILQAEALDLIHDVLLLRVESPRPIARGEQIPASVMMPGSSQVSGNIVGIDGRLVRFETVPSHAITPAARLAPRSMASAAETILTTVPPSRASGAPARSAYARGLPASAPRAVPSGPRAVPAVASAMRSTPVMPHAHPTRAIAADVLRIATGRNEIPQRVAVVDMSPDGAVLQGCDVPPGRKISVTLWLPGGETLSTLALAENLGPTGQSVRFQFENQAARLRLATLIASWSLPTAI